MEMENVDVDEGEELDSSYLSYSKYESISQAFKQTRGNREQL
jgi:hypothetical protein